MLDGMDVTELALLPSSALEEVKPEKTKLCLECDKPASRQDGRCATHSGFRLTRAAVRKAAAEKLERDQLHYARLLRRGAEIAASKGDTEPAQWALIHGGSVKPVEKTAQTQVGVQVFVGAVLPGLKDGV
jgi:hypothetical protein